MDSFIFHAHGAEELCIPAIDLYPGENVIVACRDGCIINIEGLSEEFINKHLMKAGNGERLLQLIKEPSLAGKKYGKLKKFLNDVLCNFTGSVPEIEFDLNDPSFISGLFHTPIKIPHSDWKGTNTTNIPVERWESYGRLRHSSPRLRDVINDARMMSDGKGFVLFAVVCRSVKYDPPKGTKIRKAVLSQKPKPPALGGLVDCLDKLVQKTEDYFAGVNHQFIADIVISQTEGQITTAIAAHYPMYKVTEAIAEIMPVLKCVGPLAKVLYSNYVPKQFLVGYLDNPKELKRLMDRYAVPADIRPELTAMLHRP